MAWVDFAVCFFLGMFGIHKFREKKIGMGILYLFTCGLFGFGWIYDSIKYFVIAIKGQKNQNTIPSFTEHDDSTQMNGPDLPEPPKGNIIKKILLWVLTIFFLLVALAYMPSFSSFLALLVAVLSAPIAKWQAIKLVNGAIRNTKGNLLGNWEVPLFTLYSSPHYFQPI